MNARIRVRVQKQIFDAAAEAASLTEGRRDIGALVTFTGICRDEEGALTALEIEHYAGMAEAEINRAAHEAASRFELEGILAVHRFGLIQPGEPIVFVAAAATHRASAFAGAAYLMDYLKSEAPFWKKQHLFAGPGEWVAAKAKDSDAAQKWRA